ncbi:MAG: TraM recognition domain-containing protein [SAR324 cluster bacterium]|nr:TraM recognition domain-containing protein [SAR324 cluster bacterium]
MLVYTFLQSSGNSATLDMVGYLLSHPHTMVELLTQWLMDVPKVPNALVQMIQRACHNPFSITSVGKFKLQKVTENIHTDQQYEWYVGDFCTLLAPFRQNRVLKEAFCAKSQGVSLTDLIYDKRKTLIFSGNSQQGEEGIARALKAIFMKGIKESSPARREQLGCGRSFFTFMVVDEYQHFIHAPSDNNLCVFPDDNRFFDTSREYGHINLIATQSLESLMSQVSESTAKTIVSNCMNWIALTPLIDPRTLNYLQFLAGTASQNILEEFVSPTERGVGFIFSGSKFSTTRDQFSKICTGQVPGFPHMGRFFTRNCPPSQSVSDTRVEEHQDNPFYHSLRKDTFVINHELPF